MILKTYGNKTKSNKYFKNMKYQRNIKNLIEQSLKLNVYKKRWLITFKGENYTIINSLFGLFRLNVFKIKSIRRNF